MTWKRALLIYPYGPDKKSEQLYGGLAIINPIGLEVIATALKPVVEDLLLVDMRLESEPLDALLRRFRPDLVGISLNWGRDEYTDRLVHGLPRDVTLVIGGLCPTRDSEEILREFPEMDILAVGYGEESLRELIERGSPEGVAGLWFRRQAGAYPPGAPRRGLPETGGNLVQNPRRLTLDVSHFHLDRSIRRYEYPWLTLKGDNLITSVGCPMVCAFCKWRENIFGEVQPWIARSPEDVVAELAETDADIVHIVDANFAHDPRRVERICDLLIERDIRHLYACEIRVNALWKNPALVKKMEQAGFFMFMVGIESYQPRLLKAMRKGYTVKMCREAFRNLRQTKILTLGNFLIGNPGETEAEMLGVAEYAADLGLDFISPNKIYAYANTDFEQWVLAQPGMRVVGRRRYVVSDEFDVDDLRRIQARIMLGFFRRHPPWIAYQKALAHPMVRKLGRERIRRAMLRSLWNHLADPVFRKRAVRKLAKRFRRPAQHAAG
ncbi:MAG TPA: radical SAM protein [Phycisphaerae bacterium]|nr:radical SAM protein [Phycisphaerae bacterium]